MSGWTEKDLEAYRARLAAYVARGASPAAAKGSARKASGRAARGKPSGGAKARGPNRTEAAFNRDRLDGRGIYEGVAFRLSGGDGHAVRYTPDFIAFDASGRMQAYEVKGPYRFPSENRARTAFLWARREFPCVDFRWFRRGRDGAWTEELAAAGPRDGSGDS